MSRNEMKTVDDRRGLLFTINGESEPVFQVESKEWAHASNRVDQRSIPKKIRDKVAELERNGKPGAFVRFLSGEVGVYVICEKNIRNLPEAADDDIVIDPHAQPETTQTLSPYDIVICAKQGTVHDEEGETVDTQEGDYYVVRYKNWGRFHLPVRPSFVETTKDFLHLLDDLHGKNFLAMSPDKLGEGLPADFGEPEAAPDALTCYVLNLSSFER